jgi:hypothetical protein
MRILLGAQAVKVWNFCIMEMKYFSVSHLICVLIDLFQQSSSHYCFLVYCPVMTETVQRLESFLSLADAEDLTCLKCL